MEHGELGTLDASLGISRRTLLRRGAVVGGAMVWATPVVQSFAGPAAATGTPAQDISFLAVIVKCDGTFYRMKWETTASGLSLETGPNFSTDACAPLNAPSVAGGAAPGTSAVLNSSGSITVILGSGCSITDFRIKRGQCCAVPGTAGEPGVPITGSVTFPGPTSNRENCA